MFRVKDVMTEEVTACGPDDSLLAAVQIMRIRGCGCVPVVDGRNHVVGLVTDRDAVMCALRERKALDDLKVREACTRGVVFCRIDDTLEHAETLMRVNHVGEVCAQALYTAQAFSTTDPQLRQHFQKAAEEGFRVLGFHGAAASECTVSGPETAPVASSRTS